MAETRHAKSRTRVHVSGRVTKMAERRHVQSIYETYVGKREGNKKWLKDAMSNQYETYVGKREGNKNG